MRVTDTVSTTNLNLASATASKPILTDANKNLTTGTIPISSGGTGATTAAEAWAALGGNDIVWVDETNGILHIMTDPNATPYSP